jgi:hypothetical protein
MAVEFLLWSTVLPHKPEHKAASYFSNEDIREK